MAILIYDFVTKKFDYESILHLIYILHSSQIKVLILLIITFSFLIVLYINDRIKLKNYLKFSFIILFYILLSYSFSSSSLTNKDSIYFVNIKSFFLKSKQLIIGSNQDPKYPIIGLKTINQYDFKKNLNDLLIRNEGPAYSSINKRFTEWQIATNKIKQDKNFVKLTGLEDNKNYYHNIYYGITVNYGNLGFTIFTIFIFLILFNIRKDIFQFFLYKITSERFIFLIIATNILVFYNLSMPFYHSKFLMLFFGLAYFNKIKNQDCTKK